MLPVLLLALLVLGSPGSIAAKDVLDWHAAPVRGNEVAVLVLAPGMNQDGAFFLKESPWMDFAAENNFGVIALAYKSNPDSMYGKACQGYYWPEQGSGSVLIEAIRETYGADLPILIYGFSGGAQFASRFVEWVPERIVSWAAYSAQFWDSPKAHRITPPGIVACGEHDGVRWHPSFSYFYEGRALGKPWLWVSLQETGHVRHGAFESFVRQYFESVRANGPTPAYVDVDTEVISGSDQDVLQPELLAVFPSESLLNPWREIHAP